MVCPCALLRQRGQLCIAPARFSLCPLVVSLWNWHWLVATQAAHGRAPAAACAEGENTTLGSRNSSLFHSSTCTAQEPVPLTAHMTGVTLFSASPISLLSSQPVKLPGLKQPTSLPPFGHPFTHLSLAVPVSWQSCAARAACHTLQAQQQRPQ